MKKAKYRDENPTYRLFWLQSLVSLVGLLAFVIADRFLFAPVLQGKDAYMQHMAIFFLPIMMSSAGAFMIFYASFKALEQQLREREAERLRHMQEMERTYHGLMMCLVDALETRDHQAKGHSRRVVAYALAIADKIGLSEEEKKNLILGAYLHDIGKLGVNEQVLQKPGRLSEEEWYQMRRHPILGMEILHGLDFLLKGALDVVLYHHERYDGNGYPEKLAGEEIPLLARIFAVADAFDAMTADRPYRRALSIKEARTVIREEAGRQFCPRCVEAFLSYSFEELDHLRRLAEEGYLGYLERFDQSLSNNVFLENQANNK